MSAHLLAIALAGAALLGACSRTRTASPATDSGAVGATSAVTGSREPSAESREPRAESRGQSTAPTLTSLTPDAVTVAGGAVVEILARGSGFEPGASPGKNIVEIGAIVLNAVPANAAGTELRFVMPLTQRSSGGAPPMRIIPGEYAVVIRTSKGASNPLTLRVK